MNLIEVQNKNLDWMATFLVGANVITVPREQKLLMAPVEETDEIIPRFEPVAPTDGHFFDVNKNKPKEIAKVFIEESKDLQVRVTNSEPVVTKKGKPEIKFSEYNVHARAEFEATQKQFILARKGYNLVFWISAEDGARGLTEKEAKKKGLIYADGRFNIMFSHQEGHEISMQGKHLDLTIDRFQSLEIGKKLIEMGGYTLGKVENVRDLRVQPIGFKLENMDEWLPLCRKMMPEFEIYWDVIEKGGDIKQEREMQRHVEIAMKNAGGDNRIFQLEMKKQFGHEINNAGLHGVDYLGNVKIGIQNFEIKEINGQFYSEPVLDSQGNLVCPVCGEKVTREDVTCSKCGLGLL